MMVSSLSFALRLSTQHYCYKKYGCLQNEDRRPKNEDPNFFMPDKARTGKKPSQSVPQRKQMQKITGSSFCRNDPLNLQNEDPR